MAPRREPPEPRRTAARLYLLTPIVAHVEPFQPALSEALAAADVAAVLLRLTEADDRALIDRAKSIAALVQARGAALLLEGQPDIVARAGADGAHLIGLADFTAAVSRLKPDRIAGCGGLATKHDAMLAGERGADYVMFGEPDAHGARPSFSAVRDRIAWWAELFEVPCVGYAATPQEIEALSMAGADFIALDSFVWSHEKGPAEAAKAAMSGLARA